MSSLARTENNSAVDDARMDEDCPEMTDEQFKIMRLVLSHKGVRGNSKVSFYYQGMEEARVHALKNVMDSMNVSLSKAMSILKIPEAEYNKYEEVL